MRGREFMPKTVYTNYWESKNGEIRKEHGSYASEEEALKGIEAWWELHGEHHSDVEQNRTNTGALEIIYNGNDYYYRIEKRMIDGNLPKSTYKKKTAGEIDALRDKHNLDDESFVFDELSEPFRDRIISATPDIQKARNYIYDNKGRPYKELEI